jgi:hypothetical protein
MLPTFCPDPDFFILHARDDLFVAGPCLLGASVNRVLKRRPWSHFKEGELHHNASHEENGFIPGRTIILSQKMRDMANLLIAATNLPNSKDRITNKPHYSKLHSLGRIYGLKGLYKDRKQVNEDILLFLESEYK